jgi:hypothetical protein
MSKAAEEEVRTQNCSRKGDKLQSSCNRLQLDRHNPLCYIQLRL